MQNSMSKYNFFIDPHCHLQYFTIEELTNIIENENANFKYYLTNSTSREDFDKTLEISNKFSKVIPGIGHHPWYLEELVKNDSWFEEFRNFCNSLNDKGINYFIGEIGIDGGKPKK